MRYFRWKLHHPESFPLLCQEKQLQSYFQYFICYLGAIQTQRSQLEYQVELSLDSRPSLSGQQLSHWLAAHLQIEIKMISITCLNLCKKTNSDNSEFHPSNVCLGFLCTV